MSTSSLMCAAVVCLKKKYTFKIGKFSIFFEGNWVDKLRSTQM